MDKFNYLRICAILLALVLNICNGNQLLDKYTDIDGIVWRTTCNTIRNKISEIECSPVSLPGNSNDGFFTHCDLGDVPSCSITYKNPQSFTPTSISINGIIFGDAKITVSTSQFGDFLVIDNTSHNWDDVETGIPVDIEPNMEIVIRIENVYWDLYNAIIDSIEIKGDSQENPTTDSSNTNQPNPTTSQPIQTTTFQPDPTDQTTFQPGQSTFDPIQTTTNLPNPTTSNPPHPTTTDQPDQTTEPQYSTTSYPTYPPTTDGPDWGLCKPKTWTTSSTWTDVDDSFLCPKLIKIVTKTLITTTILQRE